jgi:hypothetical protein
VLKKPAKIAYEAKVGRDASAAEKEGIAARIREVLSS